MEVWIEEILPQEKGIIGLRLYKWNQNWPDLFGNGWTTLKDVIFLILPGSFGSILCWLGTVWYLSWEGKIIPLEKDFIEALWRGQECWRLHEGCYFCVEIDPHQAWFVWHVYIYIYMFLHTNIWYMCTSQLTYICIYIYMCIYIHAIMLCVHAEFSHICRYVCILFLCIFFYILDKCCLWLARFNPQKVL